jgi:peroxiredoxin
MRHWRAGVLTLAAGAVLGIALSIPGSAKAIKGDLPPDFTGTTLDGRKITLSDFRGKNPVVLNFYAEFCGPCRKEFPHLKALDEKLGPKGLRIVAVSLDEDRGAAAAVPRESGARFPIVFDPKGSIAERYGVQAIPHTVVIDREGKVSAVLIGVDLDALDRAVAQVMK